ncbi:MAG: hypothetical protein JWP88_2328 [Flaviaesturariibacter sp.]|nr:hypothetical protein [Flaviaesturariibacter sp.]
MKIFLNDHPETLQAELERLEQLFIDRFTEGAAASELMPIRREIIIIQSRIATLQPGSQAND